MLNCYRKRSTTTEVGELKPHLGVEIRTLEWYTYSLLFGTVALLPERLELPCRPENGHERYRHAFLVIKESRRYALCAPARAPCD